MTKLGRLDKLILKGYKSIKEGEINFGATNILIGANGAGKSNFIGFFNFMRKLIQKELELTIAQMGGANKVLHFGKKVTQEIEISLLFTPNGYKATLIPDEEDRLIFKKELTNSGGRQSYDLENIGNRESNLPNKAHTASVTGHIVRYINDWKVYHFTIQAYLHR